MGMASIRSRLVKLEDKQRFLDWFVMERFHATLTFEELSTYARYGELPNPLPAPSALPEGMDRKSLIKLWEEEERILGGRSSQEFEYYAKNGTWLEQNGEFHFSNQDGNLIVEWRVGHREENREVD
jgi:hypothetical protein